MTDKKSKPSVAQSLEVIFEVATENTESIKQLASIQMDSMHLLARNSKKMEECLMPREFGNKMEILAREQAANYSAFGKAISEWESKRESMEAEIKEQRLSKVTYICSFIVALMFFIMVAYKLWQEQKAIALNEKTLQVYERFIKEDGLDKRFKKWREE